MPVENDPPRTEAEISVSDPNELGIPVGNMGCQLQDEINFEMQKHDMSSHGASDIMAADSTNNEANSFPEKVCKKPGKLLPCPRCHSLDTKFCYFNNYNVNQPRHFCRNCQRYWTAGGSLRNLPVGAGRRKSKYSASRQKHVKTSDTPAQISKSTSNDVSHGMASENHINFSTPQAQNVSHACPLSAMSSSSTMSDFGMQTSLGNVATQLSLHGAASNKENSLPIEDRTEAVPANRKYTEKFSATADLHTFSKAAVEQSVAAEHPHHVKSDSVTSSEPASKEVNCKHDGDMAPAMGSFQLPYFNPFHMLGNPAGGLLPTNLMALNNCAPGMWPGLPWPFLPPMWSPFASAWHIPWNPAAAFAAAGAAIPGLGSIQKQQSESPHRAPETDGSLWIPKTLRIGDPVEAAQSSIWTTLGLVDGPGPLDVQKSIKTAFDCKTGGRTADESVTQARQINPAAFSRSMTFNEKI